MLGINDHYLAHHRPADFGQGTLGHELGDGAYVLSRKPDLVLFNLPTGGLKPYFRSGREMAFGSMEFASTFRPVNFEAERPYHLVSIVWARAEGGPIGIRRSADRIRIPGYLFSANPGSRARLDPVGRIGVEVRGDAPAGYANLSVPPGTWKVEVEGTGTVNVSVWRSFNGDSLAAGPPGVAFHEEAPGEVALAIESPEGERAHVREVTLTREASQP
jgi:hypothetical protein